MATLTKFQEKKILRVFTMLYDSNNDGVIEKQDFDILLQKVCGILHWATGGDKYNSAKDTLETVWKGLLEYADTNKDAKITQDEWLNMWCDCLNDIEKGHFPSWQKKYMDLMFDVNDKSGDEFIDQAEYTTFFTQFGVSETDCSQAFQRIAGGSNITRDQFACLWKVYLTSNDKSAPGNSLFGPWSD